MTAIKQWKNSKFPIINFGFMQIFVLRTCFLSLLSKEYIFGRRITAGKLAFRNMNDFDFSTY